MMQQSENNLVALRERAEKAIKRSEDGLPGFAGTPAEVEVRTLVEELRVYQTELELQNQELIQAQTNIHWALGKYRALFETLPLPALIVDDRGVVQEANHLGSELLGLRKHMALQKRSIYPLFDTDARAEIYRLLRESKGSGPKCLAFVGLNIGGEAPVPFDVHIIYLDDESSVMERALLVLVNQSSEVALRESQHSFHALADSSMALIWTAGTDKLCNYFNQGWLDFTGRDLEQELGNGWTEGVHPEDFERCVDIYVTHFELHQPFSMDYRLRRRDGEFRWIRDSGTPRYDSTGRFVGYIGYCTDITDRVETEQQLRKLTLAVEQSPESIIITDKEARIEYVNAACLASTGYDEAELIGQNPRIFNSGLTPRETYKSLWGNLTQGRSWSGQFSNRRKTGEIYYEYLHVSPLRDEAGNTTHYLAVKEDVSEKKRVAEELGHYRQHLEEMVAERTVELARARDAAEVASIAKSTFLANMSHEIRTPMNAVMMLTHLLRQTSLDANQQDKLSKIASSAEHLLVVLNDILDISKIEAGKLVLEATDFSVSDVMDKALALIRDKASAKGLELNCTIDAKLPSELHGDPTRLAQALLNYLANAVKFTDSGSVSLTASLLEQDSDHVRVRFEVADTGPGIAPEVAARLFQNFEQADGSTTRRFGGTGLGLAITKRLVEMMDGDVGLESASDAGSVFWFTARLKRPISRMTLPANAVSAGADEDSAEMALRRDFSGIRVLLCEDEVINQEVMLEVLQELGFKVDIAENGAVALGLALHTCYGLVLMDMQMPVLGGLDATRGLREMPAYADVPIIAMTANAFEEDRRDCYEAGMNDFLAKPVDTDILFATLLRWLNAGRKH
ncbi:MAG: PAS domain S-box protein [Azonexus sp.]|nr:PAS domain S-box protein [Azonexus sp.]